MKWLPAIESIRKGSPRSSRTLSSPSHTWPASTVKFAERYWPIFEHKAWACSATEIEWRKHGFDGSRLGYLLAGAGLFHEAHRAVDDCRGSPSVWIARDRQARAGNTTRTQPCG